MKKTDTLMINRFEGKWFFLSNFSYSQIWINDTSYPTVEHYYQAKKAVDDLAWSNIYSATTAEEAKLLGRQCVVVHNWDDIKLTVMETGLKAKFEDIPILRNKLKATNKRILVEGNFWHDNYWGTCVCERCIEIHGQNNLGHLLMKIREEL